MLDAVERHLERADFSGWDPYDALCSPLFRMPLLRSNRIMRFGAQQLLKRSRWNLRPALGIEKQVNPVSIGLYIQGQAQRVAREPLTAEVRRDKAQAAVARLAGMVTRGYSGSCWGYPFDWETRYGSIPAGMPTVVATGIIANGLWSAYERFVLEEAAELLVSAAEFVERDLKRIEGDDQTFCWSYSPRGRDAVVNATLKGSRLLAQAHALGGRPEFLDAAARSVRFAITHQLPSGAWPYSLRDSRVDNFHTGYVLECLNAYRRHSGDRSADDAIARGWHYYRDRLFMKDMTPKYYDNRVEPLDATACAQAIITLCELGDAEGAAAVAERAIELLGLPDGSFAYQRRGARTVRTPFLRWSTAWMYCGLSRLAQEAPR
ncbi:MAG: hypothetical protein JO372_09835 [Solirubrobacterales bacterium]|nr:hypothetical protein [Solirubrobacterales bacterium]